MKSVDSRMVLIGVVCQNLFKCVKTHQNASKHVKTRQNTSTHVKTHPNVSKFIQTLMWTNQGESWTGQNGSGHDRTCQDESGWVRTCPNLCLIQLNRTPKYYIQSPLPLPATLFQRPLDNLVNTIRNIGITKKFFFNVFWMLIYNGSTL